ncbi:MAG: FtsW/RodA/SpoVE family cell cycle protein [Chloroflexota bacterium]|nr:FtsW/RodA/SpoVE family cell cycle protein [Chloroflexota bacterium]
MIATTIGARDGGAAASGRRPMLRLTESGLIIGVGIILVWGMVVLNMARPNKSLQLSLTLLGGALAAMVVVHLLLTSRLRAADQVIYPVACLLAGLGLVMIRRLRPSEALSLSQSDATRQVVGIVAGLVLMAIAALGFRDYRRLTRYKYTLAAFGFALILGTKVFGVDPYHEGYKRWFGYHGFYYQPVELLKILLVIFFAAYLDEKREVLSSAYLPLGRLRLPPLQYVGPLFTTWILALGLLLFQNDLGSALLFFGIFLSMVYVATPRRFYSLLGLVMIIAGAVVAYHLNAHVRQRVVTWIHPWPYARDQAYQLVQALIGIASGGILGEGLGQGRPGFIPIAHSDFIFSAFGEEFGLLGAMFILACYLVLAFRGLRIAALARDPFDKLLAAGLTSALVIQALVIIGGNIRLLPIAGVTLPFMSYGPSSLLSNFIIVGMLLRISANAATERGGP